MLEISQIVVMYNWSELWETLLRLSMGHLPILHTSFTVVGFTLDLSLLASLTSSSTSTVIMV